MGEESVPAFGTAPGRDRDLIDAEILRLPGQDRAEIDLDGAGQSKSHGDFRTYFITTPANTYTAMHYNITRLGKAAPFQELDALLQNAIGGATPPRVHERDGPFSRDGEIHGNAVGDGDRQQHAVLPRGVAIAAVEDEPARGYRLVPMHIGAVYLMRQHGRRKARAECRPERASAADDLPHRLVTPQAKTERPCRDPRDQPVALRPLRQLEPRDGGVAAGGFRELRDRRRTLRPY